MAFISTEQVKEIRKQINSNFSKKEGWKISIKKLDGMAVKVEILEAPIDFNKSNSKSSFYCHEVHAIEAYTGEQRKAMKKIWKACKSQGWFQDSDGSIDKFVTSYFIQIEIGNDQKDFKYIA